MQSFCLLGQQHSIRFYGYGFNDSDRIKIPLVGGMTSLDNNVALDFTIEFYLKAEIGSNLLGSDASTGSNDDWTLGHIIVDRDIFGPGDFGDYGISLASGRIAFGVNNGSSSYTLVGTGDIRDGFWHHIAVTRNSSQLQIFIDGENNASSTSPSGNVHYNPARSLSMSCPSQGGTCINEPFIVLGAEKHDFDPANYPSFNGWLDELRISNNIRYTGSFIVPTSEFTTDNNTVGLFHFNEGSGNNIADEAVIADGTLIPHPNSTNEPWSSESPFQALSIDQFNWNYDLSEGRIFFYTQPALQEGEEIHIEKWDDVSGAWTPMDLQPIFRGIRNFFWQIGYEQNSIPESYYRLTRKNVADRSYTGIVRYIQYNLADNEVHFFPNPVTNLLTISSMAEITSLEIWSTKGRLIYQLSPDQSLERASIDFTNWPPGIYKLIIHRKNGNELLAYTVLKE